MFATASTLYGASSGARPKAARSNYKVAKDLGYGYVGCTSGEDSQVYRKQRECEGGGYDDTDCAAPPRSRQDDRCVQNCTKLRPNYNEQEPVIESREPSGARCSDEQRRHNEEQMRLKTYPNNWQYQSIVRKEELAKYGWQWSGQSDHVHCLSCSGSKWNWAAHETALGEHKRLFPGCEFIKSALSQMLSSPSFSSPMPQVVDSIKSRQVCEAERAAIDFDYSAASIRKAIARMQQTCKN